MNNKFRPICIYGIFYFWHNWVFLHLLIQIRAKWIILVCLTISAAIQFCPLFSKVNDMFDVLPAIDRFLNTVEPWLSLHVRGPRPLRSDHLVLSVPGCNCYGLTCTYERDRERKHTRVRVKQTHYIYESAFNYKSLNLSLKRVMRKQANIVSMF